MSTFLTGSYRYERLDDESDDYLLTVGVSLDGLTWPRVIGGPCRGSPRDRSSRGVMSMKVHDDQSVIDKTGSTPLKYSPTVLVSTLLESWPIPPLTCEQVDQKLNMWLLR